MKKILLITFLLIPFIGFAQTQKPIDGFLGIKFGASKADVNAVLLKKGGTQANDPDPTRVTYFDVPFGHRVAKQITVLFVDGKAYATNLLFKAEVDDQTIESYNSMVNDLSQVYGPSKPYRDYKEPYKQGDGYETTGIEQGDVKYVDTWTDANKNVLQVYITVKLKIIVFYRDEELGKIADAKEKAKDSSDY